VIEVAAVISILLSFSPKIASCISAIPTATIGGISFILYGMISAVGIRNIVENKVNFTQTRNVMIAGLILVLSIGVTYSEQGSFVIPLWGNNSISFSGLSIGSLLGVIFNSILPGKDNEFPNLPYVEPKIKFYFSEEPKIERSREFSEVKVKESDYSSNEKTFNSSYSI